APRPPRLIPWFPPLRSGGGDEPQRGETEGVCGSFALEDLDCAEPRRPSAGGNMRRKIFGISLAVASALAVATFVSQRPSAQTEPDLTKPAAKEWLHVGGDWSNSRYSTLTQLTPANI